MANESFHLQLSAHQAGCHFRKCLFDRALLLGEPNWENLGFVTIGGQHRIADQLLHTGLLKSDFLAAGEVSLGVRERGRLQKVPCPFLTTKWMCD